MKQIVFLAVILTAAVFPIAAQQANVSPGANSRELFDAIAQADGKISNAVNGHAVEVLMAMFTDDLEFYHDKDGLTNYKQTADGFKEMFANAPDIRRDLVPGTLEVYPLKDYGAIEIGAHRFCHKENGKDDCGTFRFVMLWRKEGDAWKISRVVSYGH